MKEGFSKWVPMKDIERRNPVKLSNYAVENKIYHKPAFACWVPFTLHKQNIIFFQAAEEILVCRALQLCVGKQDLSQAVLCLVGTVNPAQTEYYSFQAAE